MTIFRKSVEFSGLFSNAKVGPGKEEELVSSEALRDQLADPLGTTSQPQLLDQSMAAVVRGPAAASSPIPVISGDGDQIPVRLHGGRRAWLVIPAPFYETDKVRLKAQIDLILTQDEEDEV